MSELTIKDAIEQAIRKSDGRAELKQIYETVMTLKTFKSKTPLGSIRSDLYRGRDEGRFVDNSDGTWSLGRSATARVETKGTLLDSSIFTAFGPYAPYEYKDEADLEKKVESKAREIFGPNCFYFPIHWKLESSVARRYIDGLVLDLTNAKKPKAQIVEYETAPYDLQHVENQLRDFHRALKSGAEIAKITSKVYNALKQSAEEFQRAKRLAGKDSDLHSLIAEALSKNHSIILTLDDLFPNGDFEDPKRLADRLEDIETLIEILEFKTFRRNGELIHYYWFPYGR